MHPAGRVEFFVTSGGFRPRVGLGMYRSAPN